MSDEIVGWHPDCSPGSRTSGGSTVRMPKEIAKHMKKFALLLSLVFVAGVAMAADEKPAAKTPEKAAAAKTEAKAETAKTEAKAEAGKTHQVAAEVVSVDTEKSTITIKGEKENKTVPVDAKAAGALKATKAGEKVTLTCWDNAKGEHVKVVAIAPAKVAAPAKN
jgi:tRNA threonylcarbamoyladenosine modification (KEOPS) complex  Pcc1 subunit